MLQYTRWIYTYRSRATDFLPVEITMSISPHPVSKVKRFIIIVRGEILPQYH